MEGELHELFGKPQATEDDGERKPSNPKDLAAQNERRVDFSLIPLAGQIEEALAFLEGHYKYGGHNYVISQVAATTYVNAALRHLYKYLHGEMRDPDTGVHHLGSVRACANVLLAATEGGYLIDDRPPTPRNITALFQNYSRVSEWLYEKYGPGPDRWTEAQKRKLIQVWYKLQAEKEKAHEQESERTSGDGSGNHPVSGGYSDGNLDVCQREGGSAST